MDCAMTTFKKFIVLFWAVWWSSALLTDVLGGLKHLTLLHANWISDKNYPFLVQSLQQYSAPLWLPPALFVLIIAWLFLSTAAFWRALFTSSDNHEWWIQRVNTAFIISLLLWLTFFISDQIIMNFDLEQNHMVQASFQLLTFIAIHLLPDKRVIKKNL